MTRGRPAPGSTPEMGQLAELLVRASWRLRRGSAKELAPLGVTFGQARVMRVLARAPEPMRMADLAASLEIVPRSVTTMVDSLEEAGLVGREVDPNDRRSVLVTPTVAGRSVLARMDHARRASAESLFGRLTDQDRTTLLSLLVALDADRDGTTASPGAR
ncbi:MAG TPA: MarR family transcriptional regulator [Acidimicrobiia bacterium]|nr:MarR family transcriptional regulator [Acidimicrobiia bacterium]HEV3452491.1 MarR family transcriptional regulator [Acidimicrobiia bacterium]